MKLSDLLDKYNVDDNGEYEVTDLKCCSKKMNCSVSLLKDFEKLSNFSNEIEQDNEKLLAGAFSKYIARYYYNRNIALSLCFDYFKGYILVLNVYCHSTEEMKERAGILHSLGYNFITEPCFEDEVFLDIILDSYLLTSINAKNKIKEMIVEIIDKINEGAKNNEN